MKCKYIVIQHFDDRASYCSCYLCPSLEVIYYLS